MQIPAHLLILEPLGHPEPSGDPRTFRAFDVRTAEVVTLQLTARGSGAAEPEVLAACRAMQEARVARLLSGGEGEEPYFVHEWVAGYPLANLLGGKRLPTEAALVLAAEVTGALAALHAQGVVHGDVHPGNFRVRRSGTVRLVGHRPAPHGAPGTTRDPGEARRRYLAPELAAGGAPSAAGDLYSLGLILFELFLGKPLFPPADHATHAANQERVGPALGRAVRRRKGLPEPLAQLLEATLQHARERRPRSALQLTKFLASLRPKDEARRKAAKQKLRRRLEQEARRAQRRLGARLPALAGDDPGLVASSLARICELGPVEDGALAEELRSRARDILWELPGTPADPAEASLQRAALILLHRTGKAHGDANLQALVWARAEGLGGDLLRHLSASQVGAVALPSPVDLRARLAKAPGDQEAALALALQEPLAGRPEGDTPAARRACQLRRLGFPAAALMQRVQDLAGRGQDRLLLEEVARLAQEALDESPASAPPPTMPSRPWSGAEEAGEGEGLGDALDSLFSGEGPSAAASAEELAAPPPLLDPPPLLADDDLDDDASPDHDEPDPNTASAVFQDAAAVYQDGKAAREEGRGDDAADLFLELLDLGELERERFHGPLCQELHQLLWLSLLRTKGGTGRRESLERLLALGDRLGLRDLTPVIERLLVRSLPSARRGQALAECLEARPASVPYLQACLEHARERNDGPDRARCLVSLGWRQLEEGEVALATRAFREVAGLGGDADAAEQGMQTVHAAGEVLAQAAKKYRAVEQAVRATTHAPQALAHVQSFLADYPTYAPALDEAATLSLAAGDMVAAARIHMALARRALVRGEWEEARTRLRSVLEVEPERDDVLLRLASLSPPLERPPQTELELKLELLARESLVPTALHLARKHLGQGQDEEVHAWMAQLTARAGGDPSPHHVERGLLALRSQGGAAAREHFEAALGSAFDVRSLIDNLLEIPAVQEVYEPRELLARRP